MDLKKVYKELEFVPVGKDLGGDFYRAVSYAAAYLSVPLGIGSMRLNCPALGLGQYSFFLAKPRILALAPEDIFGPFDYILGHEVSHLLHYKVNPGIFMARYEEAGNLREAIAHYGGITFSLDRHDLLAQIKARLVEKMLDGSALRKRGLKRPVTRMEQMEHYEKHEGGKKLATYLLHKVGDEGFAKLARTDVEGAKRLMKKWGYKDGLFVPFEFPE